jgi:nucleoside-diphosphate-sugar epimerase
MRPILVTGASGFVGRHVLARAAARGVEALASAGDLRDPGVAREQLRRVRPAAVIHLAGGPGADGEVVMARNLLAEADGATVLIAGSAAQYGMGAPHPLAEDAPTVPLTAYGEVKCAVERAVLAEPGRVIAARCFNIVGPGQRRDAPIPAWAGQLAAGATTLRTGNLEVVRDFLDVRDVADALLDLVASDFTGVVNVGSGVPVRLRAVVDELIARSGADVTVETDPALVRAQDPPYVVADVARLRRVTGFAPRYVLSESLADVLAEWRVGAAAAG